MTPAPSFDVDAFLAAEPRLRALARRLLGDRHAAEDVVQQAAVQGMARGAAGAGLVPFLLRVVRNGALDVRLVARRRQARERGAARAEATAATVDVVAQAELRRRLLNAVVALEEPYRTAVWLRFYEDLPPREIARRLGVPVATVHSRVQRGLARLRASLDARYGERERWALLLAPLARGAKTFGVAGAVLGGVAMKKLLVVPAAAAALLLLGLAAWTLLRAPTLPASVPPTPLAVRSPQENGATPPAARVALAPTVAPAAAAEAALSGTLRFAQGGVAAGVPYRVWPEQRPFWAGLLEAPKVAGVEAELESKAVTDAGGRWHASELPAAAARAISFQVGAGIVVSYPLSADANDVVLVLPALADVELSLRDPAAVACWQVTASPLLPPSGTEAEPQSGICVARPLVTASGPATAAMASQRQQLAGGDTCRVRTLAGQQLAFDALGFGCMLEPHDVVHTAPASLTLDVARPAPCAEVIVLQPDGITPAPLAGQVVYWAAHGQNTWQNSDRLDQGRAILWALTLREGEQRRHHVRVLMADGEQFDGEVDGKPGMPRRLTFVRGQGRQPELCLELPEPCALEDLQVLLEAPRGRFVAGDRWTEWLCFPAADAPLGFAVQGRRLLLSGLSRLPPWHRVWIVAADGRVARVDASSVSARGGMVPAFWLEATPLEPVDLRRAMLACEVPHGGAFSFQLRLQADDGSEHWVTADMFRHDWFTWAWPHWTKQAPVGFHHRFRGWRRTYREK